jgi:hypothetical protein
MAIEAVGIPETPVPLYQYSESLPWLLISMVNLKFTL